ncbi:Metallothionein expression activator [Knufia peltigerae]|uniref:Metallothionein expression activator n=1 Tax=Knufia peltigerae TaxID=1002370 RepID=A0AA38Y5X8_9EURO|nr:Metallothionein expression activator [Knufia peltigerae]
MMSNPPSSLHHQQAMHRRQNSTPVVSYEAMKVNTSMPPQRQTLHRRGQSFDQQRSPIRRQHGSTQQKIARPGQQHLQLNLDTPISPDCGIYSGVSGSLPETPLENMPMNAFMHQNPQCMDFPHSPQFYSDMHMSMRNGMPSMAIMDENNPQYLHEAHSHNFHSQRTRNLSFDARRLSQPDLRVQTQLRPHTPSHQIQTAQFPLTPPFSQHNSGAQYSRSLQASPSLQSPYPIPMARGRSLQGIIENEEFKADFMNTPTAANFEIAEVPTASSRRQLASPQMHPQGEPTKAVGSSSPAMPSDDNATHVPKLGERPGPILTTGQVPAGSASPGRPALSPRRMSISDLNLEPGISASIEETNITLDDIVQFIDGPDPVDNKWVCTYPECDKRFGRKENIKSHVQTHLGDRQFRCDHCGKCFVRGHDLKRHAKIHTGNKPYPCACGNSFARHDALTRHRQRGMCIGAFEGTVKKVVKRGRPRKHRPEMDERLDKSQRTRQKNTTHGDALLLNDYYPSSSPSYSGASSYGSPPTEDMDNLSIRGTTPFVDNNNGMQMFSLSSSNAANLVGMEPMITFPPDAFSFTPPASPGYSTGNKPSPLTYRELTPAELHHHATSEAAQQMLPDLPSMDPSLSVMNGGGVNGYSTAQSLPSLSHSSSSPAADVVAFDFSDLPTDTSSTMMSSSSQMPGMKLDNDRNDFDAFLDYGGMEMNMDPSVQDFFSI